MTLEDILETGNLWPVDFFKVNSADNSIVASAIFYRSFQESVMRFSGETMMQDVRLEQWIILSLTCSHITKTLDSNILIWAFQLNQGVLMRDSFALRKVMRQFLPYDINSPGKVRQQNPVFIINPDPYSLPAYRIGPFRTIDLSVNHCLPDSDLIDEYFNERFRGRDFIYTENGRKAINIALASYNLKKDDVVTILTTSGNFYISGCVTIEIEKFCKWSRDIKPETKILFVNHEFGYPFIDLQKLKDYNIADH